MRILIVDDSVTMRRFIRNELDISGYEIHEAVDGNKAVQLFDMIGPFDLITLDVNMPNMDGFETCRRIREIEIEKKKRIRGKAVPIVFITGKDTANDRIKGFESGASTFLIKPFEKGSVREVVYRLLMASRKNATALVVDDSDFARTVVSTCLQEYGVKVLEANNGNQGWDIVQKEHESLDVIITDLEMPGMNGADLCQRIRQDLKRKDIPIIVLSAMPDKAIVLNLFKQGATDYIVKPFVKEEFLARFDVHLENKMYHNKLQENVAELLKLNKIKDDFLAICTHDLRSPLTGILGYTDLLQLRDDNDKEETEYLNFIQNSGKDLLRLINDLLDVSRIAASDSSLPLETLSLTDIVQNCITRKNITATQKGIVLRLKENFLGANIQGNKQSFTRIIDNLLSNAIKFTPRDGSIVITLDSDSDSHAIISIEDTGIGIAPDLIQHLFEQYTKTSQSGTDGEKGTGLGLSIVKDLVHKQNGTIEVNSEIGKGTTFTLRFPLEIEKQKTT
jgi:two-component system, sensor histidine kinase and response regulator